jgi:hypothetical protein
METHGDGRESFILRTRQIDHKIHNESRNYIAKKFDVTYKKPRYSYAQLLFC